jgi:hypothetical protein
VEPAAEADQRGGGPEDIPGPVQQAAPAAQRPGSGQMPNRGHSLTIDHGWREGAQTALDFVKRFVPAKPG